MGFCVRDLEDGKLRGPYQFDLEGTLSPAATRCETDI